MAESEPSRPESTDEPEPLTPAQKACKQVLAGLEPVGDEQINPEAHRMRLQVLATIGEQTGFVLPASVQPEAE